jgi:hypothetical protein
MLLLADKHKFLGSNQELECGLGLLASKTQRYLKNVFWNEEIYPLGIDTVTKAGLYYPRPA